jgi:hypothetical protein
VEAAVCDGEGSKSTVYAAYKALEAEGQVEQGFGRTGEVAR